MVEQIELIKLSKLVNQKLFSEALDLLKGLKDKKSDKEQVCRLLVKISLMAEDYTLAKKELEELLTISPNDFNYLSSYTDICLLKDEFNLICNAHSIFIENNPSHAIAHFNCAYYFTKIGKFECAINLYLKSLSLNISDKHEVYLNIANIYADYLRNDRKAEEMLNRALSLKSNYVDAIYNLANLYEQQGKKDQAFTLFKKAYQHSPDRVNILARLLDIKKINKSDDSLIIEVERILKNSNIEDNYLCDLYYGLGKAYDDCRCYEKAFFYYEKANALNNKMLPKYNQENYSLFIKKIVDTPYHNFSSSLLGTSDFSPIFICGMYRSGSTLLEQILAVHEQVTAGGEIEFFQRYFSYNLSNFPYEYNELHLELEEKEKIAIAYKNEIQKAFGKVNFITDKRLDNLHYLGFIKQIFPKAKIIFTQRQMLDNCLSIFFLRLGKNMSYATNLKDIVHYYKKQQSLIKYWQKLYGLDTYVFDYDEFVCNPKLTIEGVLNFLGLSWQDDFLNFYQIKNTVKTASVWQVRQPIYTTSSGRWTHYAQQLKKIGIIN